MHALTELLRARMHELDRSQREVARLSGGLVSVGTVNKLYNGELPKRIGDRTLEGLANGLDVPVARLADAVGQAYRAPREFVLPPRANRLPDEDRAVVIATLDALLRRRELEDEHRAEDRQQV